MGVMMVISLSEGLVVNLNKDSYVMGNFLRNLLLS